MSFEGPVPDVYERYLVPLLLRPYARDVARRLRRHRPRDVPETAAGTGAVTREPAAVLPPDTSITATDLSRPMLDRPGRAARPPGRLGRGRRDGAAVPGRLLRRCGLPVRGHVFPDRPRAFGEARRVLRPGGVLLFSVGDAVTANEFAAVTGRRPPASSPRTRRTS
ncbi:class I SAM-dependent methyltransferase [Kitasatospora sp. NPDC059577]|uniref:class I SAM-dependent methyltransferase n=1 Tax=Kitasatospora sp. NPDC059577 TaxID=3346873 RepID=UPI003693A466